nr:conserved hypothetical protein [Melanopsichium pennsylvanicum 4]
MERQPYNGSVAAGVLTSSRFLASTSRADPHTSSVGSFRDQLTYFCVFLVQAVMPLALVFWTQYTVASALSRITRTLATDAKQHRQEGWLGFVITRLDVDRIDSNAASGSAKFELNAADLTRKLEALVRVETSTSHQSAESL